MQNGFVKIRRKTYKTTSYCGEMTFYDRDPFCSILVCLRLSLVNCKLPFIIIKMYVKALLLDRIRYLNLESVPIPFLWGNPSKPNQNHKIWTSERRTE